MIGGIIGSLTSAYLPHTEAASSETQTKALVLLDENNQPAVRLGFVNGKTVLQFYNEDSTVALEARLHLFTVYSLKPHCTDNRRVGYVGHDGTVSISPQFTEAEDFAEGLAVVRIAEGNRGGYGFIDKTGKV